MIFKKIGKFFKSQWPHMKSGIFWLTFGYAVYYLSIWFRKEGCNVGETTLMCMRQWQSLITGMVALFIASVTWAYTKASLNQSANLFFVAQREKSADRLDDDIRALDKFNNDFITCHIAVRNHIQDPAQEPIQALKDRLRNLKFPSWPDKQWEHLFDTCIDEYRDHYEKAIKLRFIKPDDFNEHGIRCNGIWSHLAGEIRNVKKTRSEIHEKEMKRWG